MCSINGFNFNSEGLIKEMMRLTKHRGPDQSNFYLDNRISLGHNRLSIIDLSEKGKQPIWNEDRTMCIICNGEIYNFQELRKELREKGHRFFSGSDSEVILHLYEDKGKECVKDLNGIFAFAIFNKLTGQLFLARDRAGVKPLYYYFKNNKLIFSSEIKGILAHNIEKSINQEALMHHFKLRFTPGPFCLINNIQKLLAGHYLVYHNNRIEIKRYWDIQDNSEIKSVDEAMHGIKTLLTDSVKKQLISDRPVGIFLSGGIDSTSILGIANQFVPGKIKTFSVGFDIDVEKEKYNQDVILATKTSQYYNTDHYQL